ncbi:hypothetical protein AGMMS50293_21360 [Spirochaetia bacterium]|nr:hypothetical protein AGMMS50293_21360 [Spirochaetia bacterium]
MSDFTNPYQSPENVSIPEKPLMTQAALTDTMLRYLKEASPWLRFIGILGFIGSGFICLGGITFAIVMFAASEIASEFGGPAFGLLGILYAALAVLVFFPSLFTYRFGASIRNYILSSSGQELEQAFKNNKSLWKFYGILCIINLAFIPMTIIIAIVGGIASLTGLLQ